MSHSNRSIIQARERVSVKNLFGRAVFKYRLSVGAIVLVHAWAREHCVHANPTGGCSLDFRIFYGLGVESKRHRPRVSRDPGLSTPSIKYALLRVFGSACHHAARI